MDALTATELRVASLVAEERSNREVAQDMYVTLKTVEGHLGRVYRKLGLSGRAARAQLSHALSGSGESARRTTAPPGVTFQAEPKRPFDETMEAPNLQPS